VGYAVGYATSKWASELLLRDAHDRLGLPVEVYRPSEIMAHRRWRGQVNPPDFFTRRLVGIVATGVAPASFYAPGTPDSRRHFDGLPVDVVAQDIAALSVMRPGAGFHTYHVVNAHRWDGISLDTIVDWVRAAAWRVDAVADYGAWFATFRDRLFALDDAQRQASPLAILEAWRTPRGRHVALADATRLVERLHALRLPEPPHVTDALIRKMLDDMVVLGLIRREVAIEPV
jgi:fatty acid CoA ligase FadD9